MTGSQKRDAVLKLVAWMAVAVACALALPDIRGEEEMVGLVIDSGSFSIKAGFAGDPLPAAETRNVVGRPRRQGAIAGEDRTESEIGAGDRIVGEPVCASSPVARVPLTHGNEGEETCYVGEEALSRRHCLSLSHPVRNGVVANWNDLAKVWRHVFSRALRVAPQEHPILLAEPALSSPANREEAVRFLFETFNVQAVFVAPQPVLALLASGRTTGLVIDSGAGVTRFVPVHEGAVLKHAVVEVNIAGHALTGFMKALLTARGYDFSASAEEEIVRDIKEELCYVALDFEEELKTAQESTSSARRYQLPNGGYVALGPERFMCPEAYFQPKLLGKESVGIHETAHNVINNCDVDIRKDLYANVVLAGGSTLFAGIAERLEKELAAFAPPAFKVKVVASPERKYATWIGGSILASSPRFLKEWVSREEFDKSGPSVINTRVF